MVRIVIIVVVFFCLFCPTKCWADQEGATFSHSVVSLDKVYIFVMLAPRGPGALATQPHPAFWELPGDTNYAASGLYRNDGSTTPLWTVNWYSFREILSNDGRHLVRIGPWTKSSSDEALTFFDQGKELRSYRVSDVTDLPFLLPHSTSHFTWSQSLQLDDERHILTLTTYQSDRFMFDLQTGEIIRARRPLRYLAVGVAFLLLFVAVLVISRRRLFL